MSRPVRSPATRSVARRVLDVAQQELRPRFVAALIRETSDKLRLGVTADESEAVARALPAAAAGRPVAELDLAVAELVARIRSDPRYQETLAGLGNRAAAGAPAGLGELSGRGSPAGSRPASRDSRRRDTSTRARTSPARCWPCRPSPIPPR